MILAEHRLPARVLDELAAGRGGVAAVERLRAAQRSKTLLAVRALVLLVRETRHPDEAAVCSAYRLLTTLPPAERTAALGHPPVAAWAFGTASLLRRGEPGSTHPGLLAAVAAAAAVRAGTDADLDVPLDPGAAGRLDLPGLGTAHAAPVDQTGPGPGQRRAGASVRRGRTDRHRHRPADRPAMAAGAPAGHRAPRAAAVPAAGHAGLAARPGRRHRPPDRRHGHRRLAVPPGRGVAPPGRAPPAGRRGDLRRAARAGPDARAPAPVPAAAPSTTPSAR